MPLQQYLQLRSNLSTYKSFLGLNFILSQEDDKVSCECLHDFLRNVKNTHFIQKPILFGILHQLMITEKYLMASRLITDYVIDIPVNSDEWLHIKNQCITSHRSSAARLLQLLTPIEERQFLLCKHSSEIYANKTSNAL